MVELADREVVIVLIRAGQGGALWLADRLLDTRAQRWDVILVEDSLYGCRAVGDRIESKRKARVRVAHYGRRVHTCGTDDPGLPGWCRVCPVVDSETRSPYLIAYVVATDLQVRDIRRHALRHLPSYAVPKRIRFVSELRLTTSGKVDRRHLAEDAT